MVEAKTRSPQTQDTSRAVRRFAIRTSLAVELLAREETPQGKVKPITQRALDRVDKYLVPSEEL